MDRFLLTQGAKHGGHGNGRRRKTTCARQDQQSEKILPVEYDGIIIETGYRLDLIVDDQVIVEIKSVESILPIHEAQLLTYLKLCRKRVGLLINFNVGESMAVASVLEPFSSIPNNALKTVSN